MWRRAVGALVVATSIVTLAFVHPVLAGTLSWEGPTAYTDNTAIPAEKLPLLRYQAYTGGSSTGPWVAVGLLVAGTSVTVPDPPAGGTLYYTVTASLDGMKSGYAVPVSKTIPFPAPAAPTGLSVQ